MNAIVNLDGGINVTVEVGAAGPTGPVGPGGITSVNGHTGESVTVTKTDVGLGSVDNTPDASKPVSTAQAAVIASESASRSTADATLQANITAEATTRANADTANTTAIINETTRATAAEASKYVKPGTGIPRTDLDGSSQTSLGRADTALQIAPVTTVAGRTGAIVLGKGDVSLANVDNTSDVSKPLSSAAISALSFKSPKFWYIVGKTGSGADFECDGTADDVQLQAAVDAAFAHSPVAGVRVIGYGYDFIYSISTTVRLKAYMSFLGEGQDVTIFKAANGLNSDVFISDNFYAQTGNNYIGYDSTVKFLEFGNFGVQGNSSNQTSTNTDATDPSQMQALIKVYGYKIYGHDIMFRDAKEVAFYTEFSNNQPSNFEQYETLPSTFESFDIKGFAKYGFVDRGPHDSYRTRIWSSASSTDSPIASMLIQSSANYSVAGNHYNDSYGNGPARTANILIQGYPSLTGNMYAEGSPVAAFDVQMAASRFHMQAGYTPIGVIFRGDSGGSLSRNYFTMQLIYTEPPLAYKLIGNMQSNSFHHFNQNQSTSTYPAPASGSGNTVLFDTSSYTGGNNEFYGRVGGSLIFSDESKLSAADRVDLQSDNYPDYNRRSFWQFPMGGDRFRMTNDGIENGFKMKPFTPIHPSDWIEYDGDILHFTNHAGVKREISNVIDPKVYGAKYDAQRVVNVTSSAGSAVVTAPGAAFTSADIGKLATVYNDGYRGNIATITSVQSATQVTLSNTSGVDNSGVGFMIYGTDDSAAIQNALNVAASMAQVNTSSYNHPLGEGYVLCRMSGGSPKTMSIIASSFTIPGGVIFDATATIANFTASQNAPCIYANPYTIISRLNLENLYGTGIQLGNSGSSAHIDLGDVEVWHSLGNFSVPTSVTATPSTTGGTLSAGTYYYVVTALDSLGGETIASTEVSAVTTGSTGSVALSWTAATNSPTGYRVYRATKSGGYVGYIYASGTSLTDTGSGLNSSEVMGPGWAVKLSGYDFNLGRLFVKTALTGLIMDKSSDTRAEEIFLIGCKTGMRMNAVNQVSFPSVLLDTCGSATASQTLGGIIIDNGTSDVKIRAQFYNNAAGSHPLPLAVGIGQISTVVNSYINVQYQANNTGGVGSAIANAADVQIDQQLSNVATLSGTSSYPITIGVVYGTGLSGEVAIKSVLSSNITPSSGIQYGTHEYQTGNVRTFTAPVTFASPPSVPAPVNATDAANKSYVDAHTGTGTVTSVGSADGNITISTPTTTPVLAVVSAPKLTTPRNINGVPFDGSANITVVDSTKESLANKGVANGYAGLDSGGKVPTGQLPSTVVGALEFQGTYDASTAVYPSSPSKGYYYVVSVAGTISGTAYKVGDWLTYDGTAWDKIDNGQAVSTVAGRTGAVVLAESDITGLVSDLAAKASVSEPLAVKVAGDIGGTAAAPVVVKVNGTSLAGLATGILKNTTSTGVPSIAVAGTDYQVPIALTTTGTSGAATLSGATLNIPNYATSGGIIRSIATVAATVTLGATALTDYVYFLASGAVPTLPTAVGNTNRYTIKNIDTTNKTLATTSSQTIDGSATITIPAGASVDVVSDTANWRLI